MENILLTNYKPDYVNNVMTISFTIHNLAISSEVSISMDDFNAAIVQGADGVKQKVLSDLIVSLQALQPTEETK